MAQDYNPKPAKRYIPVEPPKGRTKTVHVVRKGDTLSDIADMYHTTVGALRRWNNLWGKRFIYPGQKLLVWTKPDNGKRYIPLTDNRPSSFTNSEDYQVHRVQDGESLWLIAKKYGTTTERLKKLNGFTGRRCIIRPGDEIKVEKQKKSSDGSERFIPLNRQPLANANSDLAIHMVRKGDTLWDIAVAYGVSISEIKKLNGLGRRSLIKPGDKLLIPKK
jgi:membrane-bound lytic murein transglycosylase D